MNTFGFARIAVCSPLVVVANPAANLENIMKMLAKHKDADVVVLPELAITGYTCGDLFRQNLLLDRAELAIAKLAANAPAHQLIFVGAPIRVGTALYNCAVAINGGKIIGIVPKTYIPNYNEFYENRWWKGATGKEQTTIQYGCQTVNFGTDLMFEEVNNPNFVVFAEICEDLWMPTPPSSIAAAKGATVLVNLSASNETVAKNEYRMELIGNQSGRCVAAYAYASAGPSESTSDLVFSGHCVIAENGNVLAQSDYIGSGKLNFGPYDAVADVDLERLVTERQIQRSFGDADKDGFPYRRIGFTAQTRMVGLKRYVPATPFVPTNPEKLAVRCAAVFDIQCAGLAKRITQIGNCDINIGVSGGWDSTHALLVAHKTCQALGLPPTKIRAKTMPGFGTTDKTKGIAMKLMELLGVRSEVIDIRQDCLNQWKNLGHKPFGIDIANMNLETFCQMLKQVPKEKRKDLVFENVQARVRTAYLMNSGFVLGTGDLSELALGWCTYNGDHMSMYNVNASVPKTLIGFMIRYVAMNHYPAGELRDTLLDCAGLTISPELLPPDANGEIEQSTEGELGPYTLHDFYLLNFMRYGFSPEKILFLAENSELAKSYSRELRIKTMRTFISRFFPAQFKRNCVPDGPKVGSVSLSPRGDWRMPSDAISAIWMEDIPGE